MNWEKHMGIQEVAKNVKDTSECFCVPTGCWKRVEK